VVTGAQVESARGRVKVHELAREQRQLPALDATEIIEYCADLTRDVSGYSIDPSPAVSGQGNQERATVRGRGGPRDISLGLRTIDQSGSTGLIEI
jgi:hypothetical protein